MIITPLFFFFISFEWKRKLKPRKGLPRFTVDHFQAGANPRNLTHSLSATDIKVLLSKQNKDIEGSWDHGHGTLWGQVVGAPQERAG